MVAQDTAVENGAWICDHDAACRDLITDEF